MLTHLHPRGWHPLRAPLLYRSTWLSIILTLLLALPATAAPGGAALVKDLNTAPYQPGFSLLYTAASVNGRLFFVAWDSVNGGELWTSDGTAEGTALVKDINPGAASSEPQVLTAMNGTLFFVANDGSGSQQLWRSDGAPEGTFPITDLELGSAPMRLNGLTEVAGTLFFQADAGDSWELWKSDGTPQGTVRVKGGFLGPVCSQPSPYPPYSCYRPPNLAELTNIGGRLFFSADDGSSGRELWTSDGTAEGTMLVKDINPGAASAVLAEFTDVAGKLFFWADNGNTGNELWSSDGTAEGTQLVKDIYPGAESASPQELTEVNGVLFFRARDADTYIKLWRSDGTADGTFVIKDFTPSNLISFHGMLIFSVRYGTLIPPTEGIELWKSDGTPDGTRLVKDLGLGYIWDVTVAGDTLFFVRGGGSIRYPLWTSDGSAFGTVPVPIQLPGSPTKLMNAQGSLFFSTGNYMEYGLWKSDGTLEGTMPIKNSALAQGSSALANFTAVRGALFFTLQVDFLSLRLWSSNGAETTTLPVKLFRSTLSDLTELNDMVFFIANDGRGNLWRSDGSEPGTMSITSISVFNLTRVDRSLFFGGRNERGESGLWKSDGTPPGTVLVKTLPFDGASYTMHQGVEFGRTAFFIVHRSVSSYKSSIIYYALWKSDGTTQGTVGIKEFGAISVGMNGRSGPDALEALTNVNGRLFFAARETGWVNSLWTSDGTPEGTIPLTAPGAAVADAPANLTAVGLHLFFTMNDGASGPELWESDGTPAGTRLVKDIFPGPHGSAPADLTAVDDHLFFSANDGEHGRELWESDGTPEGTRLVKDIFTGAAGANPAQLAAVNGSLVFSASDGQHGREPWHSDGSADGTQLLQDIAPGGANANPQRFAFAGTHLFFSANDGIAGQELWALGSNSASIPMSGGTLAAWLDRTRYNFPAATFPATATITHMLREPAALPATGELAATSHAFEVTALDAVTGQPLAPAQPYMLTIGYTPAERGAAIEATLALYAWDGQRWIREPSSQVDSANHQITATPQRFGMWAVLGETHRMLLPAVLRGNP